jgi:hypothetical protein
MIYQGCLDGPINRFTVMQLREPDRQQLRVCIHHTAFHESVLVYREPSVSIQLLVKDNGIFVYAPRRQTGLVYLEIDRRKIWYQGYGVTCHVSTCNLIPASSQRGSRIAQVPVPIQCSALDLIELCWHGFLATLLP